MKHPLSATALLQSSGTLWGRIHNALLHTLAACLAGTMFLTPTPLVAADPPKAALEEYTSLIFVANSDGAEMKPLADIPDYRGQGSPEWSRDGKQLAFDAFKPKTGATYVNSELTIVNSDGSQPRILIDGAMPSFSPRGTRIAFSRYSPNQGVWVMSTEGPDKELVQIDENGWGTDWGADGRIAYTTRGPGGANFVIFNLVEGRRDYLFDEQNTPYRQIYWNFAWSPDAKRIVFKALNKDGKSEVGIVDARGEKFGLVHRLAEDVGTNFAWSPDGTRILISKSCPERNNLQQLFSLDPNTMDAPQLLTAAPADRSLSTMCFSPDGKKIAVSSRMPVAPKTAEPPKPPAK